MPAEPTVVRVLPDVTGFAKTFDYLVDAGDAPRVQVGTEVRVALQGRKVRAWVAEVDAEPPAGVTLQPVVAVRGVGPTADVVDLAHWAAWRWAGHPVQFLRTASSPGIVRALPPTRTAGTGSVGGTLRSTGDASTDRLVEAAVRGGPCIVRTPPGADRTALITAVVAQGRTAAGGANRSALLVCPTLDAARRLAGALRRAGLPVALLADDRPGAATDQWALAAAGGAVVVGARAAAWAPAPDLGVAVLVDEHDEALQGQQAPTWHARDVLVERCARAGAPLVMCTPCPTLEALAVARLVAPSSAAARAGWAPVEVVDRRVEDPRTASSVLSDRLGPMLAVEGRVVCVLNRTGRARLLACRRCESIQRCERCQAAVRADDDEHLVCPRCGTSRPRVCDDCGSTAMRVLRSGVSRVREELEALLGEPVAELTGSIRTDDERAAEARSLARHRVVVGTEAALHRVGPADVVAFLDFDQELTAPRFRAAEEAMALLVRAARMLGPRSRGHRLVVQTRLPEHAVLQAAGRADPDLLVAQERPLREALRFPPASALAQVSGPAGAGFVDALRHSSVEVLGAPEGPWLVRAPDHEVLCNVLAATPRPTGRLRIEVDPLRI
jgi:primosomal protein N' (replication factor Y)